MELTRQELENIIESDKNFAQYIDESDTAPDGATLDLIICAQEQDGDAWGDYDLLEFIEEACLMFRNYSNRFTLVVCPRCNGKATLRPFSNYFDPCDLCNGEGKLQRQELNA